MKSQSHLKPNLLRRTFCCLISHAFVLKPDKFAHLRVIGGTGIGRLPSLIGFSTFSEAHASLLPPKKKSWNWVGLEVYGLWFDYEAIRSKLQWIHAEMYRRYPLNGSRTNF
jgi:hypothetical protein